MDKMYFLGIGGIGMSALARYYHRQGKKVSGYDRTRSVITDRLEDEGMKLFYVMDPSHVQGQDLMVYTPAISQDSVEYQAAMQAGIPILKRAAVLGQISQAYQTLAVAGTHGKTTTSSMLAHLLVETGMDPTAFLGGLSNNLDGNFRYGKSTWMVTEADEFDRSFMQLHPHWAVITSLDPDHLDIYGTEAEMVKSYRAFADQAKYLLVHQSLSRIDWGKEARTYGIEAGDYQASNLVFEGLHTRFDFAGPEWQAENLILPLPGHHNVLNMSAALAIALQTGAPEEKLRNAVASFSGIFRRYQVCHHSAHLSYIDDYAHHPSELKAAIGTTRALFPNRQLVVIFQPHLYSRTRDFCAGFAEALSEADVVLLMEIYPAREAPIPGISTASIQAEMSQTSQVVGKDALTKSLEAVVKQPSVILSLGAGDIDKEVKRLTAWVQDQPIENHLFPNGDRIE